MHINLQKKLESLLERHEELSALLSSEEVISDQKKFRDYSREYATLEKLVTCFKAYQAAEQALKDAEVLSADSDPEIRALALEDAQNNKAAREQLEQDLQILLLPSDPFDGKNIYLEIRAAAGGDESAIFTGDLFRMYSRYAEKRGWQCELLGSQPGDQGGYKELVAMISGDSVYSFLKFESGAHRVQRVPETEAQGRIHTSTCTVAILPEIDEVEAMDINPADLRIDTYRASGAGGQHVNKTDSAIRITHLPTGVVVECQEERSQHKNRAKAMKLLQSRLLMAEQEKQRIAQAQNRRNLVGTGDRSERIRTYNYPQGRVTDHRINLTLYKLPDIMQGDLDDIVDALVHEHQADLLAEMGASD